MGKWVRTTKIYERRKRHRGPKGRVLGVTIHRGTDPRVTRDIFSEALDKVGVDPHDTITLQEASDLGEEVRRLVLLEERKAPADQADQAEKRGPGKKGFRLFGL